MTNEKLYMMISEVVFFTVLTLVVFYVVDKSSLENRFKRILKIVVATLAVLGVIIGRQMM